MGNKVELLSIHKNEIIYRKKRKKIKNKLLVPMLIVSPLLIIGSSKMVFNGLGLSKNILNNINPIYSPYVETSNFVFTSSDYDLESKDLQFGLPVICESYEIYENEITFKVAENNVVSACEDGVVVEISTSTDGVRYIKILHCDNYITQYENIDVVGVETGVKISKGDSLGLAKNNMIKLKIVKENQPVKIESISENQIVCQK